MSDAPWIVHHRDVIPLLAALWPLLRKSNPQGSKSSSLIEFIVERKQANQYLKKSSQFLAVWCTCDIFHYDAQQHISTANVLDSEVEGIVTQAKFEAQKPPNREALCRKNCVMKCWFSWKIHKTDPSFCTYFRVLDVRWIPTYCSKVWCVDMIDSRKGNEVVRTQRKMLA